MPSLLFAVTGADHWTLADGTQHPCGYWPEELALPHQIFRRAGFQITVATLGGVVPTPDKAGLTEEWTGYLNSISDELGSPHVLEDIDPASFDLIFVPGGHGPMQDLAASDEFGCLVRRMYTEGKSVAAVCHAPAALLSAIRDDGTWLFDGYRCTAFTDAEERQFGLADRASWLAEERLRRSGAVFSAADEAWGAHVVVDRNLYTGQNPASASPLAHRLVVDLADA